MSSYASELARPPRTLTVAEQKALLKVSGEHARGYRDHVMFSVALGTGLRCHEIAALNVGDIIHFDGNPKRRVRLRVYKRSAKRPARQEVIIPDSLFAKLAKFYKHKQRRAESLEPDAPMFLSQRGTRIALRSLRHVFARWQERAHFERRLGFHTLRHTAASAVYHRHKDPLLVQRFARHTSLRTTSIYMHADDEQVMRALRDQPC